MSQEVVSYYEDFSEIEKKIWDLLTNAVTDRSSEFRTPVFICGNDQDLDGTRLDIGALSTFRDIIAPSIGITAIDGNENILPNNSITNDQTITIIFTITNTTS